MLFNTSFRFSATVHLWSIHFEEPLSSEKRASEKRANVTRSNVNMTLQSWQCRVQDALKSRWLVNCPHWWGSRPWNFFDTSHSTSTRRSDSVFTVKIDIRHGEPGKEVSRGSDLTRNSTSERVRIQYGRVWDVWNDRFDGCVNGAVRQTLGFCSFDS